MSTWVDLLGTEFVIITGDEKVYTPHSLHTSWNKHYDFNISKFHFKDLPGTLVKRGEVQGRVYMIEIIFQGDDNLDVAMEFDISSRDKNAWRITHPFYGSLYVQPIWLEFNNGKLNQTIITGEVIETLLDDGTEAELATSDAVEAKAIKVMEQSATAVAENVPEPKVPFFQQLNGYINDVHDLVVSKINTVQDNITGYAAYYNNASAVAQNTAFFDTIDIIRNTQSLIFSPCYFIDTVKNRIGMMKSQLAIFNETIEPLLALYNTITSPQKRLYETAAAAAITGMCAAAVINVTDDYDYRPDVLEVVEEIINSYNAYIVNLYTLQTANAGQLDSYMPDPVSITGLAQLVYSTAAQLLTLTADAKQQRIFTLPYDNNILLIGFELYPEMNPDEAANLIMKHNGIGHNELLLVKQGRKIVYYV